MVSACAADAPKFPILKTLESRYNQAQSLQVQFSETYSGAGRAPRTEAGTLFLRKPGRMRWEYSTPPGKLFVSNGKIVYLYVPSSGLVEKRNLKQTEDMRAPLAFLLGKLNFEKEFQNIEAMPVAGGTRITADPRAPNLPYSKVEFLVSSGFEIQKLQITGQDGSILNFAFNAERLNPPVSDNLFKFTIPPGAEVVEAGQ
jgi:outer membrane lipoprotein carrier protein